MGKFYWLLLLFSFSVVSIYAQQSEISGVVLSGEDNLPVIGASIFVKGEKSLGTTTDFDGLFSLKVPSTAKFLVVSYIGMQTKEVKIERNMKIVMDSDSQELDEVVVTGYQKVDRKLFTGAAERLSGDKTKVAGEADVSRMLQGKAAGVQVQNVSGTFGAAPKIRVRGSSSIYGNQKPLWVVDGVVLEDVVDLSSDELSSGNATTLISSAIAGLNSDDIDNFQILKDASATALYGARAMNGVVVVTTKRGKQGSASISYSGEFGVRLRPSYAQYNMMNSQDQMSVFLEMEQKGWFNHSDISRRSKGGVFNKMYSLINSYDPEHNFGLANTPEARAAYLQHAEMQNTDWFNVLFKNSFTQNHSVSITSGTEKSNSYASISYYGDPGWSVADNVSRYTVNMNTSYNFNKNLSLSILTNGSIRKQAVPGTFDRTVNSVEGSVSREFDINPFSYALNTTRTLDVYEQNGGYAFYNMNYAPFNILHELENNYIDLSILDLKLQGELSYKLLKKIEMNVLGSLRYVKSTNEHKIHDNSNMALAYRSAEDATIISNNNFLYTDPDNPNAYPEIVLPKGGFYNREDNTLFNLYQRASINYNDRFNEVHLVNVLMGEEVRYSDRVNTFNKGYGYLWGQGGVPYVDYRIIKMMLEGGFDYYGHTSEYDRFAAFFLTSSYSYKGIYTVNATGRYDGSNRLGRSKAARWLPTWNLSGSWNVSEEDFLRSNQTISHLALRATYGLTANMGAADNALAIFRNQTAYRPYQDEKEGMIYLATLENSELTWEKQYETNIGFDLGLWRNRISLSMDAYLRNGFDLIGFVKTSGIGGESYKAANYANMKSYGTEFTLNTKNIETPDFRWESNLTFSYNHNEITKLNSSPSVMDLVQEEGGPREGYPVRGLFSIPFVGLSKEGYPLIINEKGNVTSGDVNFQESDKLDFLTFEGSIDPSVIGGFSNQFHYKNWIFNIFFTYQFGNKIRLDQTFSSTYSDLDAMPKEMKNRWMMSGDESVTSIPVIPSRQQIYSRDDLRYAYNAYNYSTVRVADGSFIRLKDISLSYDFPALWLKKAGISKLQLKGQASNVALLYADKKLNGQDPEFFKSGGVAMPIPKQFTLSLRVGF